MVAVRRVGGIIIYVHGTRIREYECLYQAWPKKQNIVS